MNVHIVKLMQDFSLHYDIEYVDPMNGIWKYIIENKDLIITSNADDDILGYCALTSIENFISYYEITDELLSLYLLRLNYILHMKGMPIVSIDPENSCLCIISVLKKNDFLPDLFLDFIFSFNTAAKLVLQTIEARVNFSQEKNN